MTRADLSRLLESAESDAPADHGSALSNKIKAPAPSEPPTEQTAEQPLYLRLERKEVRMREDQLVELARLARKLNKAKGVGTVRITENTLIRVAIDMLLADSSRLTRHNEEELCSSVTS